MAVFLQNHLKKKTEAESPQNRLSASVFSNKSGGEFRDTVIYIKAFLPKAVEQSLCRLKFFITCLGIVPYVHGDIDEFIESYLHFQKEA